MSLRIVEFVDEIKNLKHSNNENIIALNVCAQGFLKRKKIKFENSINFFGMDGHISILRESKKIMDILNQYINFKDKNNISLSYNDGFKNYLLFYLRYILILLYIIEKAIKKYKPKEIIIPESTPIENFDYYCSSKDRLLGHLVKKYIYANNLSIKIIEEKNETKRSFLKIDYFKKISKKLIFCVSYLIFKYFFNKKNTYLVTNDSNNFSNVVNKIKSEKPELKPIFLSLSKKGFKKYLPNFLNGSAFNLFINDALKESSNDNIIEKNIKNFVTSFSSDHKSFKQINYLNVDLGDEINIYVSNVINKALKEFNSQANFLVKIIKTIKPKFMISQHTHLLGGVFGELGNIYNIPAMVISHGSHVSPSSKDALQESQSLARIMISKNYTYIAAQNPHMLKFLKDNKYQDSQIIITEPLLYNKGNYSLEKSKKIKKQILKEHSNKKIILHAGTPKMRGNNRLFIYETVDEYIKNINDMIKIFEKKQNIFFAIKYRENPRITLKDFKELINESNNCKIFTKGSLTEFLSITDVMVSYSSTAIDEALYNKIPTILYDPDNKYSHISTSEMMVNTSNSKNGIFYFSKINELNLNIDKIIQNSEKLKKDDFVWKQHDFNNTNEKKKWLFCLNK